MLVYWLLFDPFIYDVQMAKQTLKVEGELLMGRSAS